ncbi:MAG: FAD-binding and (Fe-S)-binding domain-containing protein, partial [Desulfovibrionales bacterium]
FFGKSMHNAMLVIKDIVNLRDAIRKQGDLVKISALEEFGTKYVQAIEYEKKSSTYEGEPISVLLLQLDSDDAEALDEAVRNIVDIADPYDKVDIFAARDEREAERFWEDRHRLSAITRRTSGFKINEDVVIPLEVIPQFSDYIESLNLYYLALAYRRALEEAGQLKGIDVGDEFINMEMDVATSIIRNEQASRDLSEQEFAVQIHYFFQDLRNRYPKHKDDLKSILDRLQSTRIIVANHMHAGDGNCHVNIPVNSNDPDMMHLAEDAAERIFAKVVELKGGVSGEHGIGITKIAFLPEEKISDIREYKKKIDPNNVLNPGKLIQRELPVKPYTFSFNRLILDIDKTALPGKEILIRLLSNIQTCSRCGKCKQVCPMYYPEQGIMFHPRNKNITFGALVEALYYSQIIRKKPDPQLLGEMRNIVEHCTACGKCMAICPVKINSSEVTLELRSFLDEKAASGHPVKNRILNFLAAEPEKRIPQAAKFAAVGQNIQNRSIGLVPSAWRKRAVSPILRGPGPDLGFTNLQESLKANQGSIFLPADHSGDAEGVFYFPGCGASLFYRSIGLAGLRLLLAAGVPVALPPKHLCCGYPLLSAGCESAYKKNRARNITALKELFARAEESGVRLKAVLTSCGTCRESLESCRLADRLSIPGLIHRDVVQFLLKLLPQPVGRMQEDILYHQSCHTEFSDVSPAKAGDIYASGLADFSGRKVEISKGCCGESGMGALTSPKIYNTLRARKKDTLEKDLAGKPRPLLVSCPSCKVGLTRTLKEMDKDQPVLHTLEYLADQVCGKAWQEDILSAVSQAQVVNGTRLVRI